MSLGSTGTECGIVTQAALDYARDAGALPVVSAGNSGSPKDGNPITTPANCDGVLTVGATDPNDKIAKFSTHHPYVDVSAPGVGIFSTVPRERVVQRHVAQELLPLDLEGVVGLGAGDGEPALAVGDGSGRSGFHVERGVAAPG